MDIRFVQGFVDEIQRQKLVQKQVAGPPAPSGQVAYAATGAGPSGMIGQPGGGATGRPPTRPAPRSGKPLGSIAPPNRYMLIEEPPFPAFDPSAPNAGIPRPEPIPMTDPVTPPAYRERMVDLQGQQATPAVTPDVVIAPSGEQVVINRPQQLPEEVTPGMAGSTVDPFVAAQNTRNVVAASAGPRMAADAAPHIAEANRIEAEQTALIAERDALMAAGDDANARRIAEINVELARLGDDLGAAAAAAGEALGDPSGGMDIIGAVSGLLQAPQEAVAGQIGDLGYWYAQNQDDPNSFARVVGIIANSPAGAVLSSDGVGATDYILWIEEHPDEVAHVQENGYTNSDGQHYTGGEALYQYYRSSLGLIQQVATDVITDPLTYTGLAAGAGRMAGRWGLRAAGALPEGSIAARAAAGTGRAIEVGASIPYTVLDAAADTIVEGGLRAGVGTIRGLGRAMRDRGSWGAVDLPNSWSDVPLTAQAANVTEDADAALRQRAISREQLYGQAGFGRPGRPGPIDPNEGGPGPAPAQAVPTPQPPPTSPNSPPPSAPPPGQSIADLTRQRDQALYDGRSEDAVVLQDQITAIQRQQPEDDLPPPEEPDLTEPPTYTVYTRPEDIPTEVQSATETVYDPGAGEEIVVKRGGKKKDGTYNYRVEIDGVTAEGPTTQAAADRYARGYVMQNQPPTGRIDPVDVTAPRDPSVIPDEEVYTRVVFEDGSSAAYLDDDIVNGQPVDGAIPLATAAPDEDIAEIVAEVLDDEVLEAADETVVDLNAPEPEPTVMRPDDPTDFRAPGYRAADPGYDSVMEKHTEYLLDNFESYAARGRAEDVWRYMDWDERDRRAMLKVRDKRATTPLLQSVTDRAHAQIKWAEMVPGEPLPPQGTRALDMTPEEIKAQPNSASFSQMAERVVFGDEAQSRAARGWMNRQPKKKISTERAILDIEYNAPVATYKDAEVYLEWLRAKRDAAVEAGMQVNRTARRPLGATGAISDEMNYILNEIPRMRGSARGRRLFSRLRRARIDRKKLEAIDRNQQPLPTGDVERAPIISDEAQRLINTRIADLGNFGRADTYDKARGVIVPRGKDAGDTARIVDVYDPIYTAAREAGSTIDEAHNTAMVAVARRISEDFGQNPTSWLGRAADNLSAWHSQVSRYGDPVKMARSIFGDLIGDAMQMALREGPTESAKMLTMWAGAARRSRGWADTRAGEIVSEWGRDANGFFSGQNLVKAEQAGGTAGRSGARTMLDPQWLKMGKVDLHKVNPGRGYAASMDWMRGVNDKMEMLRRSGARIFMYDQGMTREARDFHLKAMQHRKLAQKMNITPDDIKATVASVGPRFSPEDIRLAMERLAKARGATVKDAATFGERIGRDWANIDNRIFKQSKERVNRALFSYQYSNFDTRVRRAIPFHYWATRAIPFYLETAIRNPALGMAYYELVKGLKERSEAEGWPDSLKFLTAIWTGPMGYIFFIDPVANLGLIGLTDMLFPYNDGDETKSLLGRALDMATGRSGLGIMPWLTWPAAMAGMMGDDAFALDPTGTYATQELFRAVINVASAHGWWAGAEPTVYPNLVQDALARGREITSGLAEGRIPFAREIEASDPMAYTNLQIRNGMIDLLMQEKGYDNISQMTPEDWEIINTQYTTREGNLYTDALANWADANFLDRTVGGIFVGRSPIRQEGMLQRQINQTGQQRQDGSYAEDPRGSPYGTPEPGATPTLGQAYESGANLNGRYGRTQGGLSLPREDPYADAILTEGERQFLELWRQENQKPMTTEEWQEGGTQITTVNGDTITIPAGSTVAEAAAATYQQGDLEVLRESEQYAEAMARTTPEAAPYVAGEMGYYNLGPEAHGEVINQYWNIVFADPNLGTIFIGTEDYTPDQITNMSDDDRGLLADAWLADRDADGSIRRTMAMREAWLDAHPEYAAYRDWAKEIRDSYDGNIGAYRNDLISGNPNAARYLEDQARLARMEVDANANPSGVNPKTKLREGTSGTGSVEAYYAELDQRTLNLGAYLAINGIQRNIGDPKPDAIGTPGPAPGPYDPRPAGWAPPSDESGSGGSSGGTGRTGSGGTDRSRTDWATATIAATESGVAQANALLTQAMGYPVDIMDLPPPIRDAAMAQLPPGLIPEDAWLYFDFIAWQAHQDLNNAPTDLGSYLAATANNRDWKATRSTFSAGGATLVGGTPAQVYRGGGTDSGTTPAEPVNPYLNPYSSYMSP